MSNVLTKEEQQAMSPQQALDRLMEGHERFRKGIPATRDLMAQQKATADGQYPFAVILSCIDSRTSSELIFDLGMGDAFNARLAGNCVNDDILGSMEFACKLAGSKLIVVLGHSRCGAIKGACDKAEMGNLTTLLKKFGRAVDAGKTDGDRSSKNAAFVEEVARLNVKYTMDDIKERSPLLREMIESGHIGLVGGIHDIAEGKVEILYKDLPGAA